MYFSHASFHFPSAVSLHKDTSTIPNFEMIHSMSKRLKTSMKELQRCNRSAYLPPQKRKTLKRVFSFVTVEQTGVTPGRAKKVFFQLTCCILNSALKNHIGPICILHLLWDLAAMVCHRYSDLKLSVHTLPFPLSHIFAFLIKEYTVSGQAKLVLLRKKTISQPVYNPG